MNIRIIEDVILVENTLSYVEYEIKKNKTLL